MTARLHLAPAPDADESSARRAIKVILADDHATMRRNLRLLLDREQGLEVIAEAGDVETMMRHVPADCPHVLVLDLRLPSGSSVETIRRLRSHAPDAKIVVLTMETSPAFAHQALEAGAIGFVCKEHADDELPPAVRRAAGGEEFVSARVAAQLEALRSAMSGDGLSARETEILRLIARGYTSAEIAGQLKLSRHTVETHRARIHAKLGLGTRAQLVSYALGRQLIGN